MAPDGLIYMTEPYSAMRSLNVSVIIPTHNRAAIVPRAVESALAAVRPGDEVIVLDDGSTDDTAERLATYAGRIRYLSSAHIGPGAIRNLGIREARAPLVAFLDSDDEWMPDKLELQRAVMRWRPDVLFCFSDFCHRNRHGAEIRRYLPRWHGDRRSWDEILGPGFPFSSLASLPSGRHDFTIHVGDLYFTEMLGDYVCTSTVMVRREEARSALRFAEDLRRFQDWECFGRLAGAGLAAYLDCETQWNCDHAGPRLTRADELYCSTARITILQRVWGTDPDFQARHGARYREVLAFHQRARARALLGLGRTHEAREGFRLAGSFSLVERTLATLPGSLTRAIVTARRRVKGGRRLFERGAEDGLARKGH
jgi:glycosyltransferase involved in cell wall biosynthesis